MLQTYDRENIQNWIDSENTTCPKTEIKLLNFALIPNRSISSMIFHEVDIATYDSNKEEEGALSAEEKLVFKNLMEKVSSPQLSTEIDAAKELSKMAKVPLVMVLLAEARETVAQLLSTFYKVSIHEQTNLWNMIFTMMSSISDHNNINRRPNLPNVIQLLVDGLRGGTMQARGNADATLNNDWGT